jgi:hypothetical protein
MCRTGGRRCSGSNGKAKNKLRQQIHRARRAVDTARAAGDTAAVAAGEARIKAANTALNALKEQDQRQETAAPHGDVTLPPTSEHDDTERVTVVNTNHGGTVGIQGDVVTGAGVFIGQSSGPVQTGNGVQIIGGTWGTVSRDQNAWHSAATQAARAERQQAREQRHQARQERHRAREERRAAQAGDVTGNGDIWGGVYVGPTSRDDNDSGAADLFIGRNVGGVVQGDGYTIVGGNVYRHPGRPVSVRDQQVTDAVTGQPLTPTHTVANPAAGHSVVHRGGVLYVNGVRID